ncbi:MAG TPA: hypothetical protein VJ898_00570 [Natrialbaceae archaeon]|nr:hypothetical protein [Natrialbaceae archaeon]
MTDQRLEWIENSLGEVPLVGGIFAAGSTDPIYDLLMIAAPLLVLVIRAVGRGLVTRVLVGLYLLMFLSYVVAKHVREGRKRT